MRIAYCVQNVGGVDLTREVGDTIPVKYTLRGLRQRGHSVTYFQLVDRRILTIEDPTTPERYGLAEQGISGTRPFRLIESALRRGQRLTRRPYFALFDSFRFYEVCRRYLPDYDLCHEHNGLFCLGAALACRRLSKPYVLTFSADPILERQLFGQPLRGLHGLVARWEAQTTYRLADQILCVSAAARQQLMETWQVNPAKIHIMPNGVDVNLFGQATDVSAWRAQLGVGDGPVIMFTGWFQKWHGLDGLVRSFAAVVTAVPQARLILVGDGPVRAEIESLAAELGIAHAVQITGLVPHHDVPRYLALADIVTVPYPQLPKEMWFSPLKLYEYMAAGQAIVASATGQIADIIQHEQNGILVPPGDLAALSQALIQLALSPAQRQQMGSRARALAVAEHSWDRYITRLEGIYAQAQGERRGRSGGGI